MDIAFDTSSTSTATATASHSFSHTVTGTFPILFVSVRTSTSTVSSVTYNSIGLTKANSAIIGGGANEASLWYLVGPATGANNVVVNTAGSDDFNIIAASYTGASQTNQLNTQNTNTGTGTSLAVTLTTTKDRSWVIGVGMDNGSGVLSGGTDTTVRVNFANNHKLFEFTSNPKTPAGAVTLNLTDSSSGNLAWVAAAFQPARVITITDSITASEVVSAASILLLTVADTIGLIDAITVLRSIWADIVKNVTSFSNTVKNATTFTKQSKESSSWTNEDKTS